ncbi:PLP-dependent transferase [Trichocladium antarcticum]|uniref:PLP-dependent transferase n=1 Tax=Trichocladium antarcticum TaxID=1450529 RepID=A0AAN6USP4_9PEZI|nr:PLP-dependent transferase [Trichocladium antarcticum]
MAHATSGAAAATESDFLLQAYTRLRQAVTDQTTSPANPNNILPSAATLTTSHIIPHLLSSAPPPLKTPESLSPHYYGFVTGAVLPIAEAADNLVTALDQNVQVHFPPSGPWTHSASTAVEAAALDMLVALLHLEPRAHHRHGNNDGATSVWRGKTFTTGATAANILGLACGREAVVGRRLAAAAAATGSSSTVSVSVAEAGLLEACRAAGVRGIRVLTSMGHSSLGKAASVVGLGRASVREGEGEPWRLDLDAVQRELAGAEAEGVVSIVVVSAGEVNTGRFATGLLDMPKLRSLADRYGAWIHVDGAFGLFARALPRTDEFLSLHASAAGLELADSIAADGHKLLNVPYDTGIFLCRDASILTQVCSNPNAAYLSSPGDADAILSPLNIGLENSRRFRALPVYAVLLSEGRQGIAAMLSRMVLLARAIATFVRDSEHYEWLPSADASLESTYIVVLFRATDAALNEGLVDRINSTGKMFVSGTKWDGKKAVRIAVGSWRVHVEKDAAVVREVLTAVADGR